MLAAKLRADFTRRQRTGLPKGARYSQRGTFVQKRLLHSRAFISSLMNFAADTGFDGYSDRPVWTQVRNMVGRSESPRSRHNPRRQPEAKKRRSKWRRL